MRGEGLDEVAHVAAQEEVVAKADMGGAGREQVAGIQADQILVAVRVVGHVGDHAHAKPEPDIGLDHIRVHGREHDVGRQPLGLESGVEVRSAGEAERIGHDRLVRQRLE